MIIDAKALEKLIKDSGIPHRENAGSYKFTCPKCNKPEKLWMLKNTGQFICFYCAEIDGYKGRPEYALRDLLNRPLSEIQDILYGRGAILDTTTGMNIELNAFVEDDEDLVDLPQRSEMLEIEWPIGVVSTTDKGGARGFEYLLSRGIPSFIQYAYELKYWPEKRRVMFPVEMHGKLVGYQARSIIDGETPKILTCDGMNRQRAVMFIDQVSPNNSVILCEGPIDAIKCALCIRLGGIPVAAMGKAVTREQIQEILATGTKRIYLALDPDANKEVVRLAGDLMGVVEIYLLQPPTHREDLGECTLEEVYSQFVAAKPYEPAELHGYLREPSFA